MGSSSSYQIIPRYWDRDPTRWSVWGCTGRFACTGIPTCIYALTGTRTGPDSLLMRYSWLCRRLLERRGAASLSEDDDDDISPPAYMLMVGEVSHLILSAGCFPLLWMLTLENVFPLLVYSLHIPPFSLYTNAVGYLVFIVVFCPRGTSWQKMTSFVAWLSLSLSLSPVVVALLCL